MTSWPAALPPFGEASLAPKNFPQAMASNGPISHGSGACRTLNTAPLAPQMSSALKTG
jgi:hypothetical protein